MTAPSSQAHNVDVVIAGAGPAGLAAAIELRRLGVPRVLVVDREEQAGGVPRHSAHIGFGVRDLHRLLTGPQYAARYVRLARAAGVELREATTVTRLRVPVLTSTRVSGILGRRRVEAVALTGVPAGAVRQLECDTVVFTGDWIPDHELARIGGLEMDAAARAPRIDGALRTSVRGVFAAGNLVHAAETADVAALSGRHAAGAALRFLQSGSWPEGRPIPIVCEPPVCWVSPSAVSADRTMPPRNRFVFRVAEFRSRVELIATQGTRPLWRRTFRRLIPGRPVVAAGDFISQVDPSGPSVTFRLGEDG